MESFIGIDYPTWWFLVVTGVFAGYAILDGFDLGVGGFYLFLKDEKSRRTALNAIGPVWDGNEVWLVIGGGALFAGFPVVYATVFSTFYVPFMLFLAAIIFRAVSIEFRGKEQMAWWRKTWDISFAASSILIALLLGITFGNILQGVPTDSNFEFDGSFLVFLNPYALLVGITTLLLFMMHGAIYMAMKTENKLCDKMTSLSKIMSLLFAVCFVIITVYTFFFVPHLTDTFSEKPALFIIPLLCVFAIANSIFQIVKRRYSLAFLSSSVIIGLLLIVAAIGLYPNMVLSSISPENHITVYNGASSIKTLKIMLTFAAIGVPLLALYTIFVFRTFKGKVRLDEDSY